MRIPELHETDPNTGEEVVTPLPYKWEICSHCRGEGSSSAYLGAYTSDEWNQMDYEWQEDYIAGRFDHPCEHCEGGKVRVPDMSRLTPQQRKAWREQSRAEAEYEAECRAERRALGGDW